MSKHLPTQEKPEAAPAPSFPPLRAALLPKSASGESSSVVDTHSEERQDRQLSWEYPSDGRGESSRPASQSAGTSNPDSRAANESGFGHDFGRVQVMGHAALSVQTKPGAGEPGDEYEQEADHAVQRVARTPLSPVWQGVQTLPLSPTGPLIQRQAIDGAETSDLRGGVEQTAAPPATQAGPEPAAPEEPSSQGLIVEDETGGIEPGRMRKSEFLDELNRSVCAVADAELASVGRSTDSCPYVSRWLGYYRTRNAMQIERALHRFAPETIGARSARDYIVLASERVRRSVAVWARTGEVSGVPDELMRQMPGAEETGGAASPAMEGRSSAAGGSEGTSGAGSVLFKARDGGAGEVHPRAVQARLGSGHPLPGQVKSRMESAFGHDFSRVRVHTDTRAAALSADLNARAFTIGSDIAFGAGEYQPGTPIGDALMTHELAHVVQQGGTVSSPEPGPKGGSEQNALEEDADTSAVGAVVSLWSEMKGALANVAQNALPRLKSGLKLQRCKGGSKEKETKKEKPSDPSKMTDAAIEATPEYKGYMDPALPWQTQHKMTREEALLACRLIIRTRAEGKTVTWPADAEAFMNLARKQLGTVKQAEGLKGKLQWVPFSSTAAAADPSQLQTDFGKWLLAGGPEPDATTGKVNCWEMVMFSAYKGGYTSKKRIEDIYNEGVRQLRAGTRSFMGDTIEIELKRGNEYILDPRDPSSPEPLPGDIVIFTKAKNHVAIALGTKDSSGRHKVISHWPPPDGSYKTKETTIEELLASMDPGNVVKFWSPAW